MATTLLAVFIALFAIGLSSCAPKARSTLSETSIYSDEANSHYEPLPNSHEILVDDDVLDQYKIKPSRLIKLRRLFSKKSGQPQQHQIKEKLEKIFSPDIFNMMVATMMEHQQNANSQLNEIADLNDEELIKAKMANRGYEPTSASQSSQNSKNGNNNDMMHLVHRFG